MKGPVSVAELNGMREDDFIALLAGIFEHSPWVAQMAAGQRPFRDVNALHAAMVAAVEAGGHEAGLALIRAHPDLAGKAALQGALTAESAREQAAAGLDRCSPTESESLVRLNDAYRHKFGFPFILAVRGHDRASIIRQLERRLALDPSQEFHESLKQIYKIARLRLDDIVKAG